VPATASLKITAVHSSHGPLQALSVKLDLAALINAPALPATIAVVFVVAALPGWCCLPSLASSSNLLLNSTVRARCIAELDLLDLWPSVVCMLTKPSAWNGGGIVVFGVQLFSNQPQRRRSRKMISQFCRTALRPPCMVRCLRAEEIFLNLRVFIKE